MWVDGLYRHLCWVLLTCAAAPTSLLAASQTITINTDTDFYSLTYDDRRITPAEMKEILYLSPYYPADVPSPYFATVGAVKEGAQMVRLKWFISIPLEQCNAGYAECGHEQLDPAFFANAQENLNRSRQALQKLQTEKFPEVLEPVRAYLIRHFQETLSIDQARFNFLKTGKPEELANVQCELCHCTDQASLVLDLNSAPQDKLEWSRLTWYNRVLTCIREHDPGYPMEAWQSFIKRFGIEERYKARSPA
jgi:hypothetical protein